MMEKIRIVSCSILGGVEYGRAKKVEFEINAVGEETINGYDSSFKNYEIARTKNLSKTLTLGNLEEIINDFLKKFSHRMENQNI
jgi:hypothetical protein